jgi:hypothetical protein
MSKTPFRDTASKIALKKSYVTTAAECDQARSHTWWRRLVEHGAWADARGYGRVAPPPLKHWRELPGALALPLIRSP